MHAKRYDRTVKPVVFRLWIKPQTNDFHEFVFIVLYFVAIGSFTADGGLLQATACEDNTSKDPLSQSESLQGIHVQVKNWVDGYNDNHWIDDMKYRAKPNNVWSDLKHLVNMSVVDANARVVHALKILRFRSLSFLLSVSVVVLLTVFLDRCTHTVAHVWVFIHPIVILMFHAHSEWPLRPLHSLHLLSLHLSLIFLLPYTFYLIIVVDNKPAHFRWGAGLPGQKELVHNIFFLFRAKRVKSTETNIVNSSQHPGIDCGRALRSYVRRKSWTWIWHPMWWRWTDWMPVKMPSGTRWRRRTIGEPLEAEVPRARMNLKNPSSREEHEGAGHAVHRKWSAACVEGRGVGEQHRTEQLEDEERERTTPIFVACDYGSMTQENADTFQILICQDGRYDQTGATHCERKGPAAYYISFLVGSSKILVFAESIWNATTNQGTKSLEDEVIRACASGSDSTEPPEGHHMANGRAEMAVRESETTMQTSPDFRWIKRKREHRRWQSATQQASLRFSANHEQDENWQRRKSERNETKWTKMEKASGAIWRESLVSSKWRRWCLFICEPHDSRNHLSLWSNRSSFVYYQERSCAWAKLDETDTEWSMGRDELERLVWHAVENGGYCIEVDKESHSWQRLSQKVFLYFFAEIEAHSHIEGCPGCAAPTSHGRAIQPHDNEPRERIRREPSRERQGWMHTKTEVAESERVEERNRARVERGAEDVPMELGNEEQMADRHAVASGVEENDTKRTEWETSTLTKSGSRRANEEQPDMLRKTVRFEQEAPSTSSSSTVYVSQEYLVSGRKQDPLEPVFVHYPSHVDDDIQISALDVCYQMDGRESRYIKEVLDWYWEEDARDLRRSELNESTEHMTCRNAFEVKIEKIWEKVGKVRKAPRTSWWMKNSWSTAWWRPKLIRRLWWYPYSKCLVDGTIYSSATQIYGRVYGWGEPWLLIGIPNRDPFLWHNVWKDTLRVQMNIWRNWCHFTKVFMWWCSATCDSILLIVSGCMNTQKDIRRGERTHDEEIHEKFNHITSFGDLCADECAEDAIRIKWLRA